MLMCAGISQAATKNVNFSSKATLAGTCAISTTSISFGAYDPTTAAIAYATGSIKLTCSNTMAYTLGLDRGTAGDPYFANVTGSTLTSSASSSTAAPALLNTSNPPASGSTFSTSKNALLFNIFTNASRSTIWTGFTNNWVAANQTVADSGTGIEQSVTMYGALDKSQYVTPGSYAATMIMTAKF